VKEIVSPTKAQLHKMIFFARVEGTTVTYPPEAAVAETHTD
jgi:hypothetical protein